MVSEGIDTLPEGQPIQLGLSRFAAERWNCWWQASSYLSATLTACVVQGSLLFGASLRVTVISFCCGTTLP